MLPFPNISSTLIKIGPIQIRWYGLMYLFGFLASYFLIRIQPRARRMGLQGALLQDLILFLALGLIVGARVGYVLFYQFPSIGDYLRNPLEIIAIWHGGMSFHGGLIVNFTAVPVLSRGPWFSPGAVPCLDIPPNSMKPPLRASYYSLFSGCSKISDSARAPWFACFSAAMVY
jgi:prolipoprotein diacylglyceryl transferase